MPASHARIGNAFRSADGDEGRLERGRQRLACAVPTAEGLAAET